MMFKALTLALAVPMLLTAAPVNAQASEGIYAGSYLCRDGEHGFFLDLADIAVRADSGYQVEGVLGFYPVLGGSGGDLAAVAGSFRVWGTLDEDGRIALSPGGWLVEPRGYGAAHLEGILSQRGDGLWQIEGRPVIPGNEDFCTDLIATRFLR